MSRLKKIEDKLAELCRDVAALQQSGSGGDLSVETKTVRTVVWEGRVAANGQTVTEVFNAGGIVLDDSGQTPGSGNNSAGNDYELEFSGLSADATVDVIVTGDVGAGANANAFIVNNADISGGVVTFTLYSGDDGGGVDEARDRETIVRIFDNCEVVVSASLS